MSQYHASFFSTYDRKEGRMCRKTKVLWHIHFFLQQRKHIQYVELVWSFGHAKTSPRHTDGAFVEVFCF